MNLGQWLARRQWIICHDPFPHVRAEGVFNDTLYSELETSFATILAGGALRGWPEARFVRNMPGYDASAVDFDGRVGWPFSLFVSREWHDLFAQLFAVNANRCVSGALHHHAVGSGSGFVHNDLNPGWFADVPEKEQIVIPRGVACDYRNGATAADSGAMAHETMRAVVVIFYLNNGAWRTGDGGETGLYRSARDAHAVVEIPPLNNSLVAFECMPRSFHAFRKNVRHARNSVIVWLHRDKADVLARWGESAIVPWS